MASSSATTVEEYLAELAEDRRAAISAVRDVILRNLPAGYEEGMNWGMISYEIPLERYPRTYNGQPLSYVALSAQKRYYALYLMGCYGKAEAIEAAFAREGKKLDMGKSCVRFRTVEDLPLGVIADLIGSMTPDEFIAEYEASRRRP
jgi:hypothetical protein